MTERTWARIGLALLFGLAALIVSLITLWAAGENFKVTFAVLLAIVAGLGIYIYDVRTEPHE